MSSLVSFPPTHQPNKSTTVKNIHTVVASESLSIWWHGSQLTDTTKSYFVLLINKQPWSSKISFKKTLQVYFVHNSVFLAPRVLQDPVVFKWFYSRVACQSLLIGAMTNACNSWYQQDVNGDSVLHWAAREVSAAFLRQVLRLARRHGCPAPQLLAVLQVRFWREAP